MPAQDDAKLRQVPWTEPLVARAVRVSAGASRAEKLAAYEQAADAGDIGDEAIAALVRAGFKEMRAYQA